MDTPITDVVIEEPEPAENADSDYSFEMPTKYKKAFEQNTARFNDITVNIKKIFENIEKPFTTKKGKRTPKYKSSLTMVPKKTRGVTEIKKKL